MSSSSSQNLANNMWSQSGSNNSNSQFGQNVFQAPALNQMYGKAADLYGQQTSQLQGMVPGAVDFQNQAAQGAMNANQGNVQGGVYSPLNIGQQLMGSLNRSENAPSNMQAINSSIMGGNGNTSLDAMRGSLENTAARTNALNSGTNAAQAAASGMSGGSRQGILDALNRSETNRNLQGTEAQLGYNTFNEDLNRKLGIAQQADQNTLARQNLMGGLLGQQQGTINQGVANMPNIQNMGMGQFNAANAPWSGLQNYQSALGAPTVLNAGTSSSSGTTRGMGQGQSSGMGKGAGLL